MKDRLLIMAFSVMAIALAGCGINSGERDKTAINQLRMDFTAGFNRGDTKALEPLIDRNAIWQMPGSPVINGKDSIVSTYSGYFARFKSNLDLKPGDIGLIEDGAVLSGEFARTDELLSDHTVRHFTGHYLFALKKQADGTWKATRDIWNETEVADLSSKLPVNSGKMMIVARLSVKPEKIRDFTAAATEMIEKSNKEGGCSFYQLYQDPYSSTKFVFVEEYKSQAAVDEHFTTDYFKAFSPKIAGFVSGPAEIKVISVAKEVAK